MSMKVAVFIQIAAHSYNTAVCRCVEDMTVVDVGMATTFPIVARSKFYRGDQYTSTQTRNGTSLSKSYD